MRYFNMTFSDFVVVTNVELCGVRIKRIEQLLSWYKQFDTELSLIGRLLLDIERNPFLNF